MPILAALFSIAVFAAEAQEIDCGAYRRDEMKVADLAVYANLDEYDLDHPPRVQRINYAYDYLNWVHMPGRPGFPYETNITFRFEKDTARPTSTDFGNDREIIVSIQGSWTALEEQLVVPTWIGAGWDLDSVD